MQRGRLGRSARDDEAAQWFEFLFARIDGAFEFFDARFVDPSLGELLAHLVVIRSRKQRADRKKIALHRHQDFIDAWHHFDGTREPEGGVQLVDIAVGFDAGMVLADSAAAKKSGGAFVAGSGIDLHGGKLTTNPEPSVLLPH